MTEQHIIELLEHREIKPTAMRILVLRTMLKCSDAFSLQSLEDSLESVDKSTIYRCITLFLTHHLIHAIDDGTGSIKYAVCASSCHCGEEGEHLDDLHAHFYCERCHRTLCLSRIQVPVVSLPPNFMVNDINYVLKGLCPDCAAKSCHQTSIQ
ncbi:MAG: transcriptional repressor [Muribaculaceae bacterium]|nr:transcriptional repressor [Muribaculaceae bacterium]